MALRLSSHTRRPLLSRLAGTRGAIDLASIMVGVLVIGIIAGVIFASLFTVIPWAQDSAAKGEIDAVRLSEQVGYTAASPVKRYADLPGLIAGGWIQTPADGTVTIGTDPEGTCWAAVIKSASGALFWGENTSPDTLPYEAGVSTSSCIDLATLTGSALWDIPDPALRAAVKGSLGIDQSADLHLSDAPKLTMVETDSGVSLTGLGLATNLAYLKINGGGPVTNFSALTGLTNLTFVNVDGAGITDLSPLAASTGMTTLSINGNPGITDLSPLAGFTHLQNLWAFLDTGITDLRPVSTMVSLQYLELDGTSVSDISPLSGLTNLVGLGLGQTSVSDISPISTMAGLFQLELGNTPVSDLTPLNGLAKLYMLGIGGTSVSDLTPLYNDSALTNLYVTAGSFSDPQVAGLQSALPGVVITKF